MLFNIYLSSLVWCALDCSHSNMLDLWRLVQHLSKKSSRFGCTSPMQSSTSVHQSAQPYRLHSEHFSIAIDEFEYPFCVQPVAICLAHPYTFSWKKRKTFISLIRNMFEIDTIILNCWTYWSSFSVRPIGQIQRRPFLFGKHKCEQPRLPRRSTAHLFWKFGWREGW